MKNTLIIIILITLIFSIAGHMYAKPDPVKTSKNDPAAFGDLSKSKTKSGGLWDAFLGINRKMQETVAKYLKEIKDNFSLVMLFVILFVSLIYGFIHASGPGHGKALVVSYFLDREANLLDAAAMAGLVSGVHIGSALVLATIFQLVFLVIPDQSVQTNLRSYFTIGSGIFIVCIGLYSLIEKIIHKNQEKKIDMKSKKSLLLVGIAAGIVPCPMAMAVMLLSISFGIYYVGFISVLGISFGMFALLFLIGTITIKSRQKIEAKLSGKTKFKNIFLKTIGIASASIIILFGLWITIYGFQIK